jgi:DNA repair protein RadC
MGPLNREVFKVLYLNAVNQLLDDEDLFQGTLNEAKIYPREVAKRALEKSAYAVGEELNVVPGRNLLHMVKLRWLI